MWEFIKNIFAPAEDSDTFLERYIIKKSSCENFLIVSEPENKIDKVTLAHYQKLGLKKIGRHNILKAMLIVDVNNNIFKNFYNR